MCLWLERAASVASAYSYAYVSATNADLRGDLARLSGAMQLLFAHTSVRLPPEEAVHEILPVRSPPGRRALSLLPPASRAKLPKLAVRESNSRSATTAKDSSRRAGSSRKGPGPGEVDRRLPQKLQELSGRAWRGAEPARESKPPKSLRATPYLAACPAASLASVSISTNMAQSLDRTCARPKWTLPR